MHGRETRLFKNLEQLIGSTPYIVRATVTDIQPGTAQRPSRRGPSATPTAG